MGGEALPAVAESGERRTNLLHLLATSNSITALNAAQFLLESKQHRVNEREDDGLTPLHVAAGYGNLGMCQVLMYYGADPLQEDFHGRTPQSMAVGQTKKFFDRTIKKGRLARPPSLPFLRALRMLFSCTSAQKPHLPSEDEMLIRLRRSWSAMQSNDVAGEIAVHDLYPLLPPTSSVRHSSNLNLNGSGGARMRCESHCVPFAGQTRSEGNSPTLHKIPLPQPAAGSRPTSLSSQVQPDAPSTPAEFSPPFLTPEESSDFTFVTAAEDSTTDFPVSREGTSQPAADSSGDISFSELRSVRPRVTFRDRWISEDSQSETQGEEDIIPSDVMKLVNGMNDVHLKEELELRGEIVGPLVPSTRGAYRKKLARLIAQVPSPRSEKGKYCKALEDAINGVSCNHGQKLDEIVVADFIAASALRGDNQATAFCYVLLDPTLLSSHARSCSLKEFLGSVFYIGKGQRSRPLQHLKDAVRAKQDEFTNSAKLLRIHAIWDRGCGVVSLHVFQNTVPPEALTREAAMIDAMGLASLTNIKRGDYYGSSRKWTMKQKTLYGGFLLTKALEVFHVEGCRELYEADVRNAKH